MPVPWQYKKGRAVQKHFEAINWTEVGAGLSVAADGTGAALRSTAESAAKSAEAAAHTAQALG